MPPRFLPQTAEAFIESPSLGAVAHPGGGGMVFKIIYLIHVKALNFFKVLSLLVTLIPSGGLVDCFYAHFPV